MRHMIIIIGALCAFCNSNAQNLLKEKVDNAVNSGAEFEEVQLFVKGNAHSDSIVQRSLLYQPIKSNINKLYDAKPTSLSISLQNANGKVYTLKLIQSSPTSSDARIGYIDELGKHLTDVAIGQHYQGVLDGYNKSIATMSVFANGDVMIVFSCEDGNFNMGKLKDNSGNYVLYNTQDRIKDMPVTCITQDTAASINKRGAQKSTGDIECKKAKIYWECGYDIYQTFGNMTALQNYMTGIFNFMQSIFYNDGIAIEMSSMYVWTVQDPYTRSHTQNAMFHFQRYWFTQGDTYYGDQAHLILDGNGWQGFGTTLGLCQGSAYAGSNINASQSTSYPVFDVDIYLVSHETGHTFGSQHSHWCGWMTGPNGTCGAIDNCTTLENWGVAGCTNCNSLYDANATGFKGTIMSYCGGKINFSEGFGQIISNYLRNKISNASCLQSVISTELTTTDICNNVGSITLNYKKDNFGVAPYTYLWSNSQQTKDLSWISTPGTYSVSITDSNGCTHQNSIEVKELGMPGDGITLQGTMPYCCKDTAFDVTINSTIPQKLTQCQTIAWLRTLQPLTSYVQAKTAYDNATPADFILSSNDTSINNATSATLTISSPSNCDSTTEYYYTPFITKKPIKESIFNTTSTNPTPIKNGSTTLGTYIKTQAVVNPNLGCSGSWQDITDTLTVTITNYNGRTNKLTIRVTGSNNEQLHFKDNYVGNGTYVIPILGIDDHFLPIDIRAFDFNCTDGTTCTASSLNVSATRKVTYKAYPALSFDSSCAVGKSVYLSFGPDSCNLSVSNVSKQLTKVSLYPNPTSSSAVIDFDAIDNGVAAIQIADISGKEVFVKEHKYHNGNNKISINTKTMSAGVYILSLNTDSGYSKKMKLVIK